MGTSKFAVPSLINIINSRHQILGVVTQPDKAKGRGKKIEYSPIKKIALDNGLSIYQPFKIKETLAIEQINKLKADLIVVVSYGQIIPSEILFTPQYGSINVHASLLPKYRGAAPIQRAIMDGDKETGISIMQMDEGLDTGDIISQAIITIDDKIDHGALEKNLAELGAKLLLSSIEDIENNKINKIKQDDSQATYAKMIKREDEYIDWSKTAVEIQRQIRALDPKPGAYTTIKGKTIKVFKTNIMKNAENALSGSVVAISNDSFVVQASDGALEILELQKEGKKRMSANEFLKGFNLLAGDLIDS